MTDDLATWLTQLWDECEKAAREWQGEIEAEIVIPARMLGGIVDPWRELARIAADRQILADYLDACRSYTIERTPFREGQRFGLLMALSRLAEAHADRPGYQEAWKP